MHEEYENPMNNSLLDLNGEVAVLTGAARGLGQAAAVGLATMFDAALDFGRYWRS
jgi:hypothetical protein